jgi:hypothetical protein
MRSAANSRTKKLFEATTDPKNSGSGLKRDWRFPVLRVSWLISILYEQSSKIAFADNEAPKFDQITWRTGDGDGKQSKNPLITSDPSSSSKANLIFAQGDRLRLAGDAWRFVKVRNL